MIVLEAIEPAARIQAEDCRLCLLGEGSEIVGMALSDFGQIAGLLESLDRVIADGLQHGEAVAGVPEEALLDK